MRAINRSWQRTALTVAVAALSLVLASCQGGGAKSSNTREGGNPANPELFSIPTDQQSHVEVITVEPSTLVRSLRLTGAVAYNSFHTTPVITQVSGPVSRVVVVPGQNVRQGEPMLYVASPDFSQLRTNYLKAKDAYALSKKAFARAKDLYDHHAISEQNLEQAESAEVQAGGDLVSAQSALKVLGITDPDELVRTTPTFEVPVKAPISGLVVEQNVAVGQFIQPGSTQCFMISDVNTVWVLVNVYQKDLPYVHVGDTVSIQTDAYTDLFHGRISYIAASLDPNTRTLQARIETTNQGGKLKKDMYVTATVNAGQIKNALVLPDAAILRDNENQPFVYSEATANQFGRRSVTLGESVGGKTEITSGLKPGDKVIGNGSLFLQFANSLQR